MAIAISVVYVRKSEIIISRKGGENVKIVFRKVSPIGKALWTVFCICLLTTAAGAGTIIINYQITFDGSDTSITNLSSSNSTFDFKTLSGSDAGELFAVDPGNTVSISATGDISGGFYAVGYCAACALAVTEGSIVITAGEDGVTWKDKTTGTNGTMEAGDQKTFPSTDEVTTTGSVQRGVDFDKTTIYTTVTWNLKSLPVGLQSKIVTAQLISRTVTSYDKNTSGLSTWVRLAYIYCVAYLRI